MSTKIHDGYRIHGDINAAYGACVALGEYVRRRAAAELPALVARLAADEIDRVALGGVNWSLGRPLEFVAEDIAARWRRVRTEDLRDPEVDFGATVLLGPSHRGFVVGTLARVVALHAPITRAWNNLSVPSKGWCPYWNNTDPPRGVKPEAWAARGREWDAWLAQPPLVFRCLDGPLPLPSVAAVLAALPSFEDRMRTRTRAEVTVPAGVHAGSVVEWLASTVGQRAMQKARAKVRKALPKRITRAMLLGPSVKGR